MNICFLYTLKANEALFKPYIDRYLKDPSVTISHHTNERLLQNAMEDGLTEQVTNDVQQTITEIAESNVDIIICTCSTIGDLAEKTPNVSAKVIRVDRPMAEAAIQHDNILVLAALSSTLTPTVELLHSVNTEVETSKHLDQPTAQRKKQPFIQTELVPKAWPYYFAGNTEMYARTIAAHINAVKTKPTVIVLAQTSMAPAIQYCNESSFEILTSPELCLRYLAEAVKPHA
ncbi:hypothetical protein C9J48_09120 [Photobacterium profundum]|uniref:Glutamate racemase n=1 Tax=Photobacterium profundum 3TCK TaxID=314280 RepID=Q1ZBE4_9GAMM|nr:hypothetical protein [Photobacterium profundum]EAS45198.1 hypothetical protein P3TCK_02456 [Photobacterium profundum 3TCK]PSV63596.1 hypothetical protein C9J48_09120 [Photobacterium profundum]